MTVPGTPDAIETTRTIEFGLSVAYQLNERAGKLRPLVGNSANYSSKMCQIEDRFDELLAEEKQTRNEDTNNTDMDVERRWIMKPKSQDLAPLLDRDDMRTTRLDVKSPAAVQVSKAIRRAQGDRWLQGYYGNAYVGEGEASLTSVPFKAANILAVDAGEAGAKGITLNKMIALSELMRTRYLMDEDENPEEVFALITAKQVTDLLKIMQMQSRDYINVGEAQTMLQRGRPVPFMGFTWVPTQLGDSRVYPKASTLTVDGSSYRRVPFFVKSGMHWGNWEEFFGRVGERADKKYSWQIYGETCGAATRVNEDKCFQMLCSEADNR